MSVNEIISIVLKVVCFILIAFIIPYIKKKYSQQQLEEVNEKIQTYVEAAEQIFPKEQGAEKKAWVKEKLLGLGIDIDIDYLDATLEACVLMLHNALKS